MIIIISVAVMVAMGLIFGFVLALANKKLAVEMNPLIELVEDVLPKGQCGACGFAGCRAYAEAVVSDPNVQPNLCVPGKNAVAKKVAELTDKKLVETIPRVPHVSCSNPISIAKRKYEYSGLMDCVAASLLHFGPKDCPYGCIGFGTCERNCPFGAIRLNSQSLPVVDTQKCTGCGKCETVCPKNVIHMIPIDAPVAVECNSIATGAEARKHCSLACLGCGICAKNCKYGAIKIENNLAMVDSSICVKECSESTCIQKCPTGAIKACVPIKEKSSSKCN